MEARERRNDLTGNNSCPGHARAPDTLIPQPHGGAIRPPWTSSTGAAAGRSSIRAARRESSGLLAEATPEATRRLIELMRSNDERVATIAASAILDRVHGKPTDKPLADDAVGRQLDVSHLSQIERQEIEAALKTIYRLCGAPSPFAQA